ncbi:MAG: hypothetical protein ABIK28_14925, partial [Planctomycetota bacterium]
GSQITSLHSSTLSISPQFESDRTLFYGYMGLWKSIDGGRNWTDLPIPVQIPRDIAFSPEYGTDQTVYMGSGRSGTFLSKDGGFTWTEVQGGLPPDIRTTHIALSPGFLTDHTIFISTSEHGVWRSVDAGSSWSRLTNGISGDYVRALALSPDFHDSGHLLAGTVGEGLFRSTDYGESWVSMNQDFPSKDHNVIESISYSPDYAADGTIFLVSLYDHVFKSVNQGLNWQPARDGLPQDAPREISVSPDFARDGTVFLSTHDWVWLSRNRGDSWHVLPGYNRVDDRHPSVRFEGNWRSESLQGCFSQQQSFCGNRGAFQELEFHGDSIEWVALKSADSGVAEIYVDQALAAVADLYSASTQFQVPVFKKTFSQRGWHTLLIGVTGSKNPLSSNTWIKSDGFAFSF